MDLCRITRKSVSIAITIASVATCLYAMDSGDYQGKGPDADEAVISYELTDLVYAIAENDLDTVRALLESGANANETVDCIAIMDPVGDVLTRQIYGYTTLVTPLMIAAYHGRGEIAAELIAHKADAAAKNISGKKVIDYLNQGFLDLGSCSEERKEGYKQVLEILRTAFAPIH